MFLNYTIKNGNVMVVYFATIKIGKKRIHEESGVKDYQVNYATDTAN